MELRKTSENVTRTFDADGNATDRVDNISYDVLDSNGNSVGNAHVNSNDAGLNVSIYDFGSVEEGEARLKELFGIAG